MTSNIQTSDNRGLSPALRDRLELCGTLPSLPAVAIRILKLCQREDLVDLKQIADAISQDPALSAKIIRLVNSPSFGLRQEIRTVPHALTLLGLNAVRTLALSFSLVRDLRKGAKSGLDSYWKRSLVSAVAAREVARGLRMPTAEEAFFAALLQDIGILAMARVFGADYDAEVAAAGKDHARLVAREVELWGADHAAVGAWLAQHWNMPESLRTAVRRSHEDAAGTGMPDDVIKLARLVRIGGLIAEIWCGPDPAAAMAHVHELGRAAWDLDQAKLEPILAKIAAAVPEVGTLFDLKMDSPEQITAILEQAKETLVMVTLRASRQADSAREAIDNLQQQTRVLEEASQRDKLTRLYNRVRLDSYLDEAFAAARNSGKCLSVVMADVDHFKKFNDTYGHATGDQVLIGVAQVLGSRLRPRDLVARFGGEEFVLVLPETDAAGAMVVAERIRSKVETTPQDGGANGPLKVTASFGCATLWPTMFASVADLMNAADQALYVAKRAGRNRSCAHVPTPAVAPSVAGRPSAA